ncbi:ankyrin repeat-containing domain protein [Mycena olivaceomarginata]|nr:ankyrin repeat-containing domain protein [Mycena olivaceomarginata]
MSPNEQEPNADRNPSAAPVNHPHTQDILSAISSSNIPVLTALLKQSDIDPDAYPGPPRETMLLSAAYENQPISLAYLLQRSPSKEDVTPPLLVGCSDHIECYKVLVAAHPHTLSFGLGHTGDVFGAAVLRGDLEFMRYAANESSWNIDISASEVFHRPALQYAAEYSQTRVLRCLLVDCGQGRVRVGGADVIRAAIRGKNMDNLRCLLEHSPEGTKAVVDGWPLKLDEYPWELERRKEFGWDVPNLHYAVAQGNAEAVRILLDAGANADLLDEDGRKADIDIAAAPKFLGFRTHTGSARSCSIM